ncbi:MAG: YdcF family protein [Nitrospirae bacterium]|nr:YdcF family protein [Nitrospirota bacterium]MDA1303462.1 YdcF family protein [Nitrospirota bacterium]
MFLFKKIFSRLFFPVPLSLELMWVGLVCMWLWPQRRFGKLILMSGVLTLTLLSFYPLSQVLLKPLESQYPPLLIRSTAEGGVLAKSHQVKWIVVLAGGAMNEPSLPLMSQLSSSSVLRVVEGIALYRFVPGVKLLVSGSLVEAELMSQLALSFGVPGEDVVSESNSRDTKDQALRIANIVAKDPLVLVTEASHMPRSMGLFHKQGLSPIAAPVGHRVALNPEYKWWTLFPNAESLKIAQRAIYEYLGLAWAMVRGQI